MAGPSEVSANTIAEARTRLDAEERSAITRAAPAPAAAPSRLPVQTRLYKRLACVSVYNSPSTIQNCSTARLPSRPVQT